MWWDATTIAATVTRQFVCSHLPADEVQTLDRPLAFAGGLTDGTYWEWINEKSKRIFLILIDLGCPSQIFALIDDSWDDDDLPITMDQVGRLAFAGVRDDRIDHKFYFRQFHYLVRYLDKGGHIVYHENELVPFSVLDKRSTSNNSMDRIEMPNKPGEVFTRRRIPLGSGPGFISYEEFLYEVDLTKNIQNDHVVSYYGSYTHLGFGYVLFYPSSDFNLKCLLTSLPTSIKSLNKQDRRDMVMNWIHCLVDTLCYIHSRGSSHGNIKPSSVLFSTRNQVFYNDLTRLSREALGLATSDRSAFDKESYDYAAPEQWYRPSTTVLASSSYRNTLTSPVSPDTANFTISHGVMISSGGSGGEGCTSPRFLHGTPTPHLNPQAADIFSLGCVILELLSFLMKRQTKAFAGHRAMRHKTPGRGGAVPDSSFHKNLGQVESWMAGLAKDAAKKASAKKDEQSTKVFRGVAPTLHLVARMLAIAPHERLTAREVEHGMYRILTEDCGITEPHCVHEYGGWDSGLGNLRIGNDELDSREGKASTVAPMQVPESVFERLGTGTRSEPPSLMPRRSRSKDRETIDSYGGRSDPGARHPGFNDGHRALQIWQHHHHAHPR